MLLLAVHINALTSVHSSCRVRPHLTTVIGGIVTHHRVFMLLATKTETGTGTGDWETGMTGLGERIIAKETTGKGTGVGTAPEKDSTVAVMIQI